MRRIIERLPSIVFGALVVLALWPVAGLAPAMDRWARSVVGGYASIREMETGLNLARALRESGKADHVVLADELGTRGIRAIDRITCAPLDRNLVADPTAVVDPDLCAGVRQTWPGEGRVTVGWVELWSVPDFERVYPHSLEIARAQQSRSLARLVVVALPLFALVVGALVGVLLLWLQGRLRRKNGAAWQASCWVLAGLAVAILIQGFVGWSAITNNKGGGWNPGPSFLAIYGLLVLAVSGTLGAIARSPS